MSTTQKTQSTLQFNQPSMGVFGSFQPTIQSGLMDFANDPMKATYFNQQLQFANRANQNWQNAANQQLFWNQRALGPIGDRNAFLASQLARNQRAGMSRQADTFTNLLLNAQRTRMAALEQMQGYRPLQTGQTTTQTSGGLGSWLSPLIGMGVKAFTGGFGSVAGGIGAGNALLGSQASNRNFIGGMPTYTPYSNSLIPPQ